MKKSNIPEKLVVICLEHTRCCPIAAKSVFEAFLGYFVTILGIAPYVPFRDRPCDDEPTIWKPQHSVFETTSKKKTPCEIGHWYDTETDWEHVLSDSNLVVMRSSYCDLDSNLHKINLSRLGEASGTISLVHPIDSRLDLISQMTMIENCERRFPGRNLLIEWIRSDGKLLSPIMRRERTLRDITSKNLREARARIELERLIPRSVSSDLKPDIIEVLSHYAPLRRQILNPITFGDWIADEEIQIINKVTGMPLLASIYSKSNRCEYFQEGLPTNQMHCLGVLSYSSLAQWHELIRSLAVIYDKFYCSVARHADMIITQSIIKNVEQSDNESIRGKPRNKVDKYSRVRLIPNPKSEFPEWSDLVSVDQFLVACLRSARQSTKTAILEAVSD